MANNKNIRILRGHFGETANTQWPQDLLPGQPCLNLDTGNITIPYTNPDISERNLCAYHYINTPSYYQIVPIVLKNNIWKTNEILSQEFNGTYYYRHLTNPINWKKEVTINGVKYRRFLVNIYPILDTEHEYSYSRDVIAWYINPNTGEITIWDQDSSYYNRENVEVYIGILSVPASDIGIAQ